MTKLDVVERTFAELLGYLAYKSASTGMETDDIQEELVTLLERYIARKVV